MGVIEQHDETSKIIRRIMTMMIGYSFFCLLTLAAPDTSFIANDSYIKVPFANTEIIASHFLLIGPLVLIAIAAYLHIYMAYFIAIEHTDHNNQLPFIFNIKRPKLAGLLSALIFYLLPPVTIFFFWRKSYLLSLSTSFYLALLTIIVIIIFIILLIQRRKKHSKIKVIFLMILLLSMPILMFINYQYKDGAYLYRADLQGKDLRDVRFIGANMIEANFTSADLRGAVLKDADLQDALLVGAKLQEAILTNANLNGVNFKKANLEGANLEGAQLEGVNFRGAYLQKTNLKKTTGLTVDKFSSVVTLYKAELDHDIKTKVDKKFPYLFLNEPHPTSTSALITETDNN